MTKIATGYDKAPRLVCTVDALTAAPVAPPLHAALITLDKLHSTKFLGIPILGPVTIDRLRRDY